MGVETPRDLNEPAALKELAFELRFIAEKRLPEVFLDPTEDDTVRFPLVCQIVRALEPSKWEEHPPGALSAVVRRAIGLLSDEAKPTHCKITWRRMARILYGFVQLEPKSDGSRHRYHDYTEMAERESEYLGSDFKRRTREVREALASALVKLYEENLALRTLKVVETSPGSTAFLDRPAYREQIACLVSKGQRLISIYGEPGTGKSTLAEIVANELAAGKPTVTLHMADQKILERDIVRGLKLAGLQPETWTEAACWVALHEQLGDNTSLGAIIVDDVTDATAAFAWTLIPEQPTIPVILTSRKPLQHANLTRIELGEFTEGEAHAFINQALPGCEELDRQNLIKVLGRRPLALFHAVRFLAKTKIVQPAELVAALGDKISESLNLIEPSLAQTPKLPCLYGMLLEEVVKEEATRNALDAFIAATGNSGLCRPALLSFAMQVVYPSPAVNIRLQAGLNSLQQWGLIRMTGSQWGDSVWAIHPLTLKVLRELRHEEQRSVVAAYLQGIFSGDVTAEDAALLHRETRATRDLHLGWKWLLNIDEETWIACREWPDKDGELREIFVRYEILPKGVLRHDFTTGERGLIELSEAKQLFRLMRLYEIVCNAAHGAIESDLVNPDAQDYGLQCLKAFLPCADADWLRLIVSINSERPIFYRDEAGSRALAEEAAVRLNELNR